MKSGPWVLAAALLACSSQSQPPTPAAAPTPLGVETAAPPTASAEPGKPEPPMSIAEFAPLWSAPELSAAALALEKGAPAAAAVAVEAAMADHPPPAHDVKRWQFLLATLRERAGQAKAAAASYDLAAQPSWPLRGYALLGAGRMLARAGDQAAALERLKRVPLDQPTAEETRLLAAEVAARQGDYAYAIDTWRAYLAARSEPPDWVQVSLRLGEALIDRLQKSPPKSAELSPDAEEALRLARRVRLRSVDSREGSTRAQRLEERALQVYPPASRAAAQALTPEDQLAHLEALVGVRRYPDALTEAEAILEALPKVQRWAEVGCEVAILRAKALAGQRQWGEATDSMGDAVHHCQGTDQRARLLYLAGKYAAADGRNMQAVRFFEELEQKAPAHRLADDARLHAAECYFELGVEARFTELLTSLPEDYPKGDMVLDGVFQLAIRRIEKQDWSGAASVLDRGAMLVVGQDSARGTEFSGRERYFRARAWVETGERERGLDEYAAIIGELPLSYYMLHAYSRLANADPGRAAKARAEGERRAREQPFEFAQRPEFLQPGFVRAMELLRQGEIEPAKREIEALGLMKRGAAPEILWGVTLLYARAGAARHSHAVARGLLTDWLARWPAGDWMRAWELAFPRPYQKIVEREAKKNGVPEALVYAVMREESAFDPDAVSPADAHGLMQLIVPTAKLFAKPVGLPWDARSLKRPTVNIALGTRALAKLSQTFETNPLLAIPGYNAGPGRPRRWRRERPRLDFDIWVELIPIRETRRYTKRVLASRAAYAYLYAPETAEEMLKLPLRVEP